jgi:uncharacterized protein YecE (DUF72 family)
MPAVEAYARPVRDAPALTFTAPAPGVMVGGCRVLAGSSSWADRSLVRDGSFYPSRSLSASQRLLHYTSRLPLTEVATTYRFPPTPDVAKRWVASTPAGFTMDVRAWSLLCGAPTWPESLWADLQGLVRPSRRDGAKLYRNHLPSAVLEECWDRFNHAVRPLAEAGRLGAVVVRFPSWFSPRPAAWEELAELPGHLPGACVAVELTNERWFEGDACEQTLGLLEDLGLSFVCRDGPGPRQPTVAATSEVGFVRFTGSPGLRHEVPMWPQVGEAATDRGGAGVPASGSKGPSGADEEETSAARSKCPPETELLRQVLTEEERSVGVSSETQLPGSFSLGLGPQAGEAAWSYRYSDAELAAWAPAIRDLASCTREVHLIMDNCWRANAVDNAASLLDLLAR